MIEDFQVLPGGVKHLQYVGRLHQLQERRQVELPGQGVDRHRPFLARGLDQAKAWPVSAVADELGVDGNVRKAGEMLAELGLTEKASRKGADLSGGERRRVEITRALVLDPQFMMLDEPFAGVDPIAVIDIQKIIEQLKARGIGVIITDHNVRETLSICDRAYIIKDGTILRLGTPAEIAEDPEVREVYLGKNFSLN